MDDLTPLNLLVEQRRQHWLLHCRLVLEQLLIPLCRKGIVKTTMPSKRSIVLIDNRPDEQWLFTLLNTWLMCPTDSGFVLVTDSSNTARTKDLLMRHAPELEASVLDAEQLVPETQLGDKLLQLYAQTSRILATDAT